MPLKLMPPDASIFDSGADMLVCPVNCVGVAGKGLALEFKKRFPWMDSIYRELCATLTLRPGGMVVWITDPKRRDTLGTKIALFPTKNHRRGYSQLSWIDDSLQDLSRTIHDLGWKDDFDRLYEPKAIAIPALGCGLGGLAWTDVLPLIEQFAKEVEPVTVMVYPPKENA